MRIIAVTGWRHHTDGAFIRKELNAHNSLWACSRFGPMHVRVGDAEGADAIVLKWCRDNGVGCHEFKARRYSGGALMKGAGPQRNREMLLGIGDPVTGPTNLVLAFPRTDGKLDTVPGSGTWGCAMLAARMGIKVEIPAYRHLGD